MDKQQLITDHMEFAKNIARKTLRDSGCSREDIEDAEGNAYMALCEVVETYKPGKASFMSYAFFRIRSRIIEGIGKQTGISAWHYASFQNKKGKEQSVNNYRQSLDQQFYDVYFSTKTNSPEGKLLQEESISKAKITYEKLNDTEKYVLNARLLSDKSLGEIAEEGSINYYAASKAYNSALRTLTNQNKETDMKRVA